MGAAAARGRLARDPRVPAGVRDGVRSNALLRRRNEGDARKQTLHKRSKTVFVSSARRRYASRIRVKNSSGSGSAAWSKTASGLLWSRTKTWRFICSLRGGAVVVSPAVASGPVAGRRVRARAVGRRPPPAPARGAPPSARDDRPGRRAGAAQEVALPLRRGARHVRVRDRGEEIDGPAVAVRRSRVRRGRDRAEEVGLDRRAGVGPAVALRRVLDEELGEELPELLATGGILLTARPSGNDRKTVATCPTHPPEHCPAVFDLQMRFAFRAVRARGSTRQRVPGAVSVGPCKPC